MNPTKNILLTAAIAGLVAGASINAQADHHEDGKAGAEKHEGKGKHPHKAGMHAGKKAGGKDSCKGKDGCKGGDGCHTDEHAAEGAAAPAPEKK